MHFFIFVDSLYTPSTALSKIHATFDSTNTVFGVYLLTINFFFLLKRISLEILEIVDEIFGGVVLNSNLHT